MKKQPSIWSEWGIRLGVGCLMIPATLLIGVAFGQLVPKFDPDVSVWILLLFFFGGNLIVPTLLIQRRSKRNR